MEWGFFILFNGTWNSWNCIFNPITKSIIAFHDPNPYCVGVMYIQIQPRNSTALCTISCPRHLSIRIHCSKVSFLVIQQPTNHYSRSSSLLVQQLIWWFLHAARLLSGLFESEPWDAHALPLYTILINYLSALPHTQIRISRLVYFIQMHTLFLLIGNWVHSTYPRSMHLIAINSWLNPSD